MQVANLAIGGVVVWVKRFCFGVGRREESVGLGDVLKGFGVDGEDDGVGGLGGVEGLLLV